MTPVRFLCLCLLGVVVIHEVSSALEGCATANVNIRTGPSTRYRRVGLLRRGRCLTYKGLSRSRTWARVSFGGRDRWIYKRYLRFRNTTPRPPPRPTPTGIVPASCLRAICRIESGCRQLGCGWDVNGYACGYYQIHAPYYTDCYKPGRDWKTCSRDKSCAERCVNSYMKRYARRCTGGRAPTCQDIARIHNGGPVGCRRSNTLGYWRKVQKYL